MTHPFLLTATFIILNVAIEGYSGTIDPAFTNTEMIVDYGRIYQ